MISQRHRAAALGAALLLAAASPAAAESVLRYVPYADLPSLDPLGTTATVVRDYGYLVYDTLFAMDENLQPQPQMVGSYEASPDRLTYTFTLRDGLKWHDGKPVTAEDCIASLKRWGAKDQVGTRLMAATESLTAVDEKTFRLVLAKPFGLVLEALAQIDVYVPYMMPKRLAETPVGTAITEAVGSGPFKFVREEWQPGAKVVYAKNADYVPRKEKPSGLAGGKVPMLDRIEWRIIPDAQTAVSALVAGEIDYIEQPSYDLLPILKSTPGVSTKVMDLLGNQFVLRMNHATAPFDNPKVRQAVAIAVKQESYLQAIAGEPDNYRLCRSVYACGSAYASEPQSKDFLSGDIAKAKALLKESGYKGEKVVILQPAEIPTQNTAALVTAQLLRQIGMTAEVQAMDWPTLTQRRAQRKPVAEGGWSIVHTTAPANLVSSPLVNPFVDASCEKAWVGWPCDAEVEKLKGEFVTAPDEAARKKIAAAVQERSVENVSIVPLGQLYVQSAFRSNIKGLRPFSFAVMWGVSKDPN